MIRGKLFNTLKIILILTVLLVSLVACKSNENNTKQVKDVAVQDSSGNAFVLKETPKSVVSLESSLACIWKLAGGKYTGVPSNYEDFDLTLDNATGIGNFLDPNIETIVSVRPDFIIYSTKPAIENHEKVKDIIQSEYPEINFYGTSIDSFDDYLYTLEQFCNITGNNDAYDTYGLKVRDEIQSIISKVPNGDKPKVLFIRARSDAYDVISSNNFVASMLNDLNTENIGFQVSVDDGTSNVINEGRILDYNPDYIFIVYMGNSSEEIEANLKSSLYNKAFYSELNAVKNNKVYILDKKLFNNKPNEKWAVAYQTLFDYLYGKK